MLVSIRNRSATWWAVAGIIIGAFLSLAGIGVGLYSTFHKPVVSVVFEVASETNVLDVRTPLPELQIVFRGNEIQRNNLNLRIFRVSVLNNGDVDITQALYDQESPWGLAVAPGQIISARLVDASTQYLRERVTVEPIDDSRIGFSKVILERGQSFTVEVLVLHNKDEQPKVIPVGKIAGINSIRVSNLASNAPGASLISQIFVGSLEIQLVRAAVYLFFFVVLMVGVTFAAIGVTALHDNRRTARRERKLSKLIYDVPDLASPAFKPLRDLYVSEGDEAILALEKIVQNEAQLRAVVKWTERDDHTDIGIADVHLVHGHLVHVDGLQIFQPEGIVGRLIETGCIATDGTVTASFVKCLQSLAGQCTAEAHKPRGRNANVNEADKAPE
jgi:hypothetical protein